VLTLEARLISPRLATPTPRSTRGPTALRLAHEAPWFMMRFAGQAMPSGPASNRTLDTMNYRRGVSDDAEGIASLIASFQGELTDDPSGVGAEQYRASVTVDAERGYMQSDRYLYIVAAEEGALVGFIAIRDRSHVFHLFVAKTHQRRGIARQLWKLASTPESSTATPSRYTVNSSLNAVPVYEALGFISAGSIMRVHGISFLPMQQVAPAQ
jgi:ribosomal protein S18 acetylase RimI-like enzyme